MSCREPGVGGLTEFRMTLNAKEKREAQVEARNVGVMLMIPGERMVNCERG